MSIKFIAFEGVDGSGKTTISESVSSKLLKAGYNIAYVNKKEIDGYSTYVKHHLKSIKRVLWDYGEADPLYELGDDHWLFLNLSWFSAVYNCLIKELVEEDKVVIVDNWYSKLLARFSVKANYNKDFLNMVFSQIPKPDVTIFLDVDPSIAVQRRSKFSITETGQMDKRNNNFVDYQLEVRDILLKMAKHKDWYTFINNSKNVDNIVDEIYQNCVRII